MVRGSMGACRSIVSRLAPGERSPSRGEGRRGRPASTCVTPTACTARCAPRPPRRPARARPWPRALGAWLIGEVTAAVVQDAPKIDRGRRTLFLPDFVVVTLVEHGPRESGPVLVTRTGACMSPANLRRLLRAAVAEAGLDFAVTPHTLRRTLATFLAREIGTREVADQLGHADPAVTLSNYIAPEHRGPDAPAAISSFIQGPLAGSGLG